MPTPDPSRPDTTGAFPSRPSGNSWMRFDPDTRRALHPVLRSSLFLACGLALLSAQIAHPATSSPETGATPASATLPRTSAAAQALRQRLQTVIPRLAGHVVKITPAPVLGLWELFTDERQLLYTDDQVSTLINGDLIDPRTLRNLTEERLKVLGAIKPDSLPLQLALKKVKGNGRRTLVVFSDPDCPYCRKLENELSGITDLTIYTFIYPIAGLHPNAPEHARWIWCAPQPLQAWENYLQHDILPAPRSCPAPELEQIQTLGAHYRISGTPTLIFGDGQVIPGVMPRPELERALGPD